MTVLTDVKQKVQDLLPDQIGTGLRWTDSYVNRLAIAADYAASDKCEYVWRTQEIDLVGDQAEYDLNSGFINVISVEFSSNGTDYDDYLMPTTFNELDSISTRWRDDSGDRPEWYVLLGCPGMPETVADAGDSASILVYRTLSSVDSEAIKVGGYGIRTSGLHSVDDAIMDMVHVPYVLSVLLATSNPTKAIGHYQEFLYGCDKARARSV